MSKESTREAYGRTLCELGATNDDIVVVDADLTSCTMTSYFAKQYPERFSTRASGKRIWLVWVRVLPLQGKQPL